MGYIKQNFVSGQTLRADHLNHIEDGIVSISKAGCDWNLMDNKPFYDNTTADLMFELDVTLSRIQQIEGSYYSGSASTTFYLEDSPYYSYFKANTTYRVTIGDRVELLVKGGNAPTLYTDKNSSGNFDSTCEGFYFMRTGGQMLNIHLDSTYGNGESEITKHIIVEKVDIDLKTLDEIYLPDDYINSLIDTKLDGLDEKYPTKEYTNELIDAKLGVIENGTY